KHPPRERHREESMTPEEHAAWLEEKVRELSETVERINASLLPVQRLTWEVEKDKEIQTREDYERLSNDYNDVWDALIDAKTVLEEIAKLPEGCTPSANIAISKAKAWLESQGGRDE